MHIISMGDLSITNKNNHTVFSFRIPSQRHVDFVEEHNAEALREQQPNRGGSSKAKKKKPPKAFGKNKKPKRR